MKLYQIFFCFLLYQFSTTASQDEILFEQANQLFFQARYKEACQVYQKVECKSFPVLYNMSLAYLYQGDRFQAMLGCKRAEKIGNYTQLTSLYELLDFMKHQINPEYEVSWDEQLCIFLKKCILSISIVLVQWWLLIALALLLIVWWYRFWVGYTTLLYAHVIVCLLLGLVWHYKILFLEEKVGIVSKKIVPVFAGPHNSFYKKAELHEADDVVMVNKQNDYCQIQAKSFVGWVDAHDIEFI